MSIDELSAMARGFERIVITGGEPLAQDIGPLVDALHPRRHVTVETSGTIFADLPGVALFSISPKVGTSGYRPKPLVLRKYCASAPGRLQFKFVIGDDRDLGEAYDCMADIQDAMPPSTPVILQPESGRAGRGESYHVFLRGLADDVVADDRWRAFDVRVLPQLHYLLWGGEPGR
jgi:7-carboxy-7-deazaguanine synthase